jgi:predicted PurR-regulated permease PerM
MSSESADSTSPPWQPGTRLIAGVLMLLITVGFLYLIRTLLVPLLLALLLAYLLHPLIQLLTQRGRLRRSIAVLVVYVGLIFILLGSTTGLGFAISQRVSGLATYLYAISVKLPEQIEALATQQINVGSWSIDFTKVNLEPILSELASAISPLLSQTGSLMASLAKATASALSVLFLALIFGYYLLLDIGKVDKTFLEMVPGPYRKDFRQLLDETGLVWNAFLRGQAILAVIMTVLVAVVLGILGVNFPVALGLVAGLMEFVPWFGPIIATVVTVLVALFQNSNWWGLTPLVFGLVVLIVHILIQQVESNVLFPRIIGQSLNLNPLIVLFSVLAGGLLAGLVGLLLAAPTVATLRIWLGYVYQKTVGLDTWPDPVISPALLPERPILFKRLRDRWQGIQNRFKR